MHDCCQRIDLVDWKMSAPQLTHNKPNHQTSSSTLRPPPTTVGLATTKRAAQVTCYPALPCIKPCHALNPALRQACKAMPAVRVEKASEGEHVNVLDPLSNAKRAAASAALTRSGPPPATRTALWLPACHSRAAL